MVGNFIRKYKRRLAFRGFPSGYLYLSPTITQTGTRDANGESFLVLRSTKMSSKKNNKKKKQKKTALVICRGGRQFWTTQTQFWQWVREAVVIQTGDNPATGFFCREHEELMVVLSNTVLNLAHPNHLREALLSRRLGMSGK